LEPVWERIKFQAIRAAQSSIIVKPIRAQAPPLPFGSELLDLVVANGVLEWAGYLGSYRDPAEGQRRLLAEAYRVLKPGGCLYVGIENRFAWNNFLGAKDHSGLPFTTLMSRKLADGVVRLFAESSSIYDKEKILRKGYRTFTYSLWTYVKMLREAGFEEVDTYWVYPGYNMPTYSGRIADGPSIRLLLDQLMSTWSSTKSAAGRAARQLPCRITKKLVALLWPNFMIYAYKGKKCTFESQLMETLGGDGFLGGSSFFGYSYRVLKDGSLFSFARTRVRDEAFRIEQECSYLREFGNVPEARIISVNGRSVMVTPRLHGVLFDPFDEDHNRVALKWLRDFQRRTENGSKVTDAVNEVNELSSFVRQLNLDVSLKTKILKAFSNWLSISDSIKLSPVASHGDFWAGNIILGPRLRPFVFDWEHFKAEDTPLFDLLFFVLTNSLRGGALDEFQSGFSRTGKSAVIGKAFTEFCATLGVKVEVAWAYMPCAMVRFMKRARGFSPQYNLMSDILASWDMISPEKG
jgi:ubiquinone/menaquinone biosynthesis C-methylase UbiE